MFPKLLLCFTGIVLQQDGKHAVTRQIGGSIVGASVFLTVQGVINSLKPPSDKQ